MTVTTEPVVPVLPAAGSPGDTPSDEKKVDLAHDAQAAYEERDLETGDGVDIKTGTSAPFSAPWRS